MATLSAPFAESSAEFRVVYRHGKPSWVFVLINLAFASACFVFACLPLVNMGPLTPEEISKKHVDDMQLVVWIALFAGALFLLILLLDFINKLCFRCVADKNGLKWRSFLEWNDARWNEVSDCLMLNKGATPRLMIGKRRLDFESKSPHWLILREAIETRVSLPSGLQFWHEPLAISAEERRAQMPKVDDGAVLTARSGLGWFAIFGVLMCGPFAFLLTTDPKGARPSDYILLLMGTWMFLGWPLASQIRDFVIADDQGLRIGQMFRQRRVLWADIEDLFLLRKQNKSTVFWKPCVLVAGDTIELTPLGKARDAILNRVEARAIYAKSRQFEKREFTPVGNGLVLPATLEARLTLPIWLHKNGLLALTFAGSAALVAWTVDNIGWENFGSSRGMLLWASALWALLAGAWLRRIIQKIALRRARGTYRVIVDDAGLSREDRAGFTHIEWAQVARLERDCGASIWDTVFRVEDQTGATIEWDDGLEKSSLLATLAREKCAHDWQDSVRAARRLSGMMRTDDALLVSENNVLSRLWAGLWLGMWALIPSVMLCDLIFNPPANWRDVADSALWMLVPPMGLPLFFAAGALLSMARVQTVCDAQILIHRGWFRERRIEWRDVAEVGLGGGGLFDFVRTRDGQTIRIWLFPSLEASSARHELRAEIMRRATGASGAWKPRE